MEKMLLKSTTRHVRIFTAQVVDNELQFHPNKLTLDLDPDNEFIWNEDSLNKRSTLVQGLSLSLQEF